VKTQHLVGGVLVAACFALTAAVYTRLPDPMPTHFDLAGHADGFSAKPLGPFTLPIVALATWAVTLWAPGIPRERAARALGVIPIAVAAMMLFLVAVTLRLAMGTAFDLVRVLVAGVSLYLAVRGNYLGRVPRNWLIGIRTPWTLADDEVWQRTNRLAGWLFVLGGPLAFVAAVAGAPLPIAIAPLAAATLVATVYSFVVYRRVRASGATS
jgi:uncharacterized membrane protein